MKLGSIGDNQVARCFLCQWEYGAPDLSQETLEELLLEHLWRIHDRRLFIKEPAQEKTVFHGRNFDAQIARGRK